MNEIGKPLLFNLGAYYETIDGFINSDEVEIAQYLINHPPAFFRDFPPEKLLEIKERLNAQLWTAIQYKGIYDGVVIDEKHTRDYWPTRALIIQNVVQQANDAGITPNISELAPGSLWVPYGLTHHGLKFTYERLSLDDDNNHPFARPENPQYNIFCATEIIEHLHNPDEIYQNYLKFKRKANLVLITTPLYTYGGGMDRWQERELGHLRTYSPKDLEQTVSKMFPGYKWQIVSDSIIHAIGTL